MELTEEKVAQALKRWEALSDPNELKRRIANALLIAKLTGKLELVVEELER